MRLRWRGPADTTITGWQYTFGLETGSYSSWTDMPGSGAETRRHTVTGLANNNTYKFKIRAVNGAGPGAESDERTGAPYAVHPARPAGLQAVSGDGKAVLLWDDPDDSSISGWEYKQRSSDGAYGSYWTAMIGANARTTRYAIEGLENGNGYAFKIRAYNSAGNGVESAEVSTTPMPAAPEKPGGFSVEPGNRKVTLHWDDPENAAITKWQYAFRTTGDFGGWLDVPESGAGTTRHVVAMLENDTLYTFKIRAVSEIGNGAESDEVSATPTARAPAKPAGLTAIAGDSEVTLSWTDPSDASIETWQYAYRTTGNFGNWIDVPGSSAATTRHSVAGLENGTAYTFKLRAVNDVGEGPESVEASATPLSVPAKPAGFAVTAGDARVVLSWDNPLNSTITGWQYSFRTSGEYGGWIDIPGSDGDTTRHTVTGLTNAVGHTFRLRAVNGSGNGAETDGVSATPQAVPAKPVGLAAQAGNMQTRLTWTDPDNSSITGWQYGLKTTGGYGPWADVPGSDAATVRYTVTNLVNDTTYSFKIRAVNGSGAGPESGEVSATPLAAPPAKPEGFAVAAGDRKVLLEWNDPDDSSIQGWQFKHRASDGAYGEHWNNIPGSGAKTTRHEVTGLTNGTTYVFKIRAVNSTNGFESEERAATPRSLYPAAPTGFQANAGDGRATLSWDDPADATITGWQYSLRTSGDFGAWTAMPASNAATTSFVVTGLSNGTAYGFKLRAVNANGPGAESDEITVTPRALPAKPEGFAASPGDGRVFLTWDDPRDATITVWQYSIRSTAGDERWIDISGSGPATTDHTVTALSNGTAYSFRLRALNPSGFGTESEEVVATPGAVPAQPVGLAATPGNGEVVLEWQRSNDRRIAGWQYNSRTTGAYGDWIDIAGSNRETSRFVAKGLVNGIAYSFKIRAATGSGHGAESEEVTATPFAAPAKPIGFSATPGDGQVLLAWNDPDDPAITGWQYKQRRSGGPAEDFWTYIPGSGGVATRFTVIGLDNGVAYAFRLRAVSNHGFGHESDEVSATPAGGLPAAPEALRASPGDRQVRLEWENPDNPAITGWQYSFATNGSFGAWRNIPGSDASVTGHTVPGLANGTAYRFRVRAVTASGPGPPSETARATPEPSLPDRPVGLEALPGKGLAVLTWTDPGNPQIVKWQVVVRTPGDRTADTWQDIAGSDANTTRYVLRALENGRTYLFRVRACVGEFLLLLRCGPGSDPVTATLKAVADPVERSAMKAVMASLAGRLAAGAETVIGTRFSADREASSFVLAGHELRPEADLREQFAATPDRGPRQTAVGMSRRDLLTGTAFQLPLGPHDRQGHLRLMLWHKGDLRTFRSSPAPQSHFGGQVLSGWLGIDLRLGQRWLFGTALARSEGEVDYAAGPVPGVVRTVLDSVHPYAQRRFEDGGIAWVTLGGGRGRIENIGSDRGAEAVDVDLASVSAGFHRPVPLPAGIELAASGVAGFAWLGAGGNSQTALGGVSSAVNRQSARLDATLEKGGLSSYMSVSVRRYAGGGMEGTGLELTAGVRTGQAASANHTDIRARWLAQRSDRDYREHGLSVATRQRAGAGGLGPSWSLTAAQGEPEGSGGGLDRLWADDMSERRGYRRGLSTVARAGWGFRSGDGTITPYAALGFARGNARRLALGLDVKLTQGLRAKFAAERRIPRAGTTENRVIATLRAGL